MVPADSVVLNRTKSDFDSETRDGWIQLIN